MRVATFIACAALALSAATAQADKTTGEVVDDTILEAEVKTRLVGNDFFGGMGVNIETHQGIVQLGGFVTDLAKAAEMAAEAESIEGVRQVDNQLHQRPAERSAGQVIDDGLATTRIKAAIADADLGDGLSINIDTYNGVTLLTGFVATAEQKQRAESIAAKDDNTRQVINGIYVTD